MLARGSEESARPKDLVLSAIGTVLTWAAKPSVSHSLNPLNFFSRRRNS